jgi:hypothetical protein
MRYEKEIKQYRAVTNQTLDGDEVMLLGQPPYPGLTLFKLFLFFVQRMEALQTPTQQLVNRLVEERVAVVTAELEQKWAGRIAGARLKLGRM